MFNFVLKRRGTVVNILKRHVVKRQINCNGLSRSYPLRDEMVKNVEKQFWIKHMRINDINDRKYSSLPEPLERKISRRVFVSNEDSFAHSILESKEIYSENIVKSLPVFSDEITENEVENYINKSWKSLPIPEIVQAFKRISYYALRNEENILDEKYAKFIKYLITNCEQFTDSEMSDVLLSLALWPVTYTRHDEIFKSLYSALDKDCVRRASQWTVNELLLFSDHWYKLQLYRYVEFALFVIKKLGSRPNRMTSSNLVQYMFYANASRTRPKEMYNLEYKMETHIDELDVNELAILAMGFFKSQAPIRNTKLLNKIIRRVIENIDTIHEIALSAFLKIVRYSFIAEYDCGIIWELLVSTIPQIPRLSLQALVHIIAASVKIRIFHPELMTCIAQRFSQEIKDARIKDMERLVLGLTCFNFTPDIQPNIFHTIIEELRTERRLADLKRYSKSLASLLQYLSVVNLYPKDLIAFTLDSVNLKPTYGPSPYNLNQVVLVLDLNIDTEVPDYVGPRLDNRTRSIIVKGYANKIPEPHSKDLSARHNFLVEIMDTCKEILGSPEMMHLDWVLPQYREADLIICLDKNNSPLSVQSILSEMPSGDVKRRPENCPEGSRWLALVVASQNCYIRNTNQLLGKDIIKIRQLERIGYKPVVIPWYEWYASPQDQKKYLEEKIFK